MEECNLIIDKNFSLDGQPFKIISGSIHYFRTVPEYWLDRLEKLKAMGANTVETYIPWNLHENEKGIFSFEGILDIERFIKLAQQLGLYVIIRPSPYICAEWEFGGLPAWLLAEDGMRLRINYEPFMKHVEEYYKVLFPKLVKYQLSVGGPIILMQIENEYGYYGTDTSYMERMKNLMIKLGVTVPLITSDGPYNESMNGGSVSGALPTGNFGSKTEERFTVLSKYTENGPLMCAEFWVGWFDHWGNGGHMRGNLEESIKDLDKMLEMGHVNIYMFQGGTNFGFMNGSNYSDKLYPDVTSYDYDGILTEDGQITEKYRQYQKVISKYVTLPDVKFSMDIKRKNYGEIKITEKVSLFSVLDNLSSPVENIYTQSMEVLGQNYGYTLYQSKLQTEESINKIKLWKANDRANLYINQEHILTLYDRELLQEHELNKKTKKEDVLSILVENMGRVNFGPAMEMQRKGIDHCVQINGHIHHNWIQYTLPLDNVDKIDFTQNYVENTPAFYRAIFEVEEIADTFLDFEGWGKGCVFVNGFNIGRFWEIGPQRRLYIPGPLLKKGENEVILFETEGKVRDVLYLKDEPDIG